MTEVPLESLRIQGFRSIGDTAVDLSSAVTVLVGPNGSGKSNVVDAFELLGRIVDRQLNDYLLRLGGFSAVHRKQPDGAPPTITLTAWGERDPRNRQNGYRAILAGAADDTATLHEAVYFWDHERYPERHHVTDLELHRESVLSEQAKEQTRFRYARDVMTGCRVFHFDDVSPDAPPKTLSDLADNVSLAPDAGNIAAVLLRLRDEEPVIYQRITRSIRVVAPYFDDFVLRPAGDSDKILLRWRERGLDSVLSAKSLSDGTLRFVCLAVLLQQPDGPATIVLDEPELGLHPFAIHQLAELFHRASRERKIVAATQSVTLLNQFDVAEVAIVERTSSGTTVRRLDAPALAVWLDDYSVGELWEKNLLGGRPRPDHRRPA